MKHAALTAGVLALAAMAGSSPALAQAQYPAFTSRQVNVRAGPSREYPVVAVLPPGFQVLVQGCLSDFAWCDVVAGYERGWVYAGNILYNTDNNVQPIITWGPMIGIGVIGFAFHDYWPRYYWNRPWYRERHRWEDVRPPRHAGPPRPPLPAAPPPGWQPQPQLHPRPVPQPQPPRPQFQPRPVPVPQPSQVQPVPVPQTVVPAQPQPRPPHAGQPAQPHPGVRAAPPQPPGAAQPRPVPAPRQDRPGRGGERPMPQQREQEREHG